MPTIGLAGGIGAGKSAVARVFETLGAAIIDSDELAHQELRHPEVIQELIRWWGGAVRQPDGMIDRRQVGRIVFSSPKQLRRLEGLLYPRLARRRERIIADLLERPEVKAIIIDAPKLFEAGVDSICDVIVFVDAPLRVREDRVRAARGWTPDELMRREKLQIPLDQKRARADYIIENDADLDGLRVAAGRVFQAILAAFSR